MSSRPVIRPDIDFALYLRRGWREPPLELKFNANHDPANGQFTSADGVASRLTPEARTVAAAIGRDFFLRTGKPITIKSGTRDPAAQADAMLQKEKGWDIYKNQRAIAEIRDALARSRAAGGNRSAQVAAMAEVISRQATRGIYVSDHLKSRALDIGVRTITPHERAMLVEISRKHARKVLDEHDPPHVHVQY